MEIVNITAKELGVAIAYIEVISIDTLLEY